MPSPTIYLIDDHPMFRSGLGMLINMALPEATLFEASTLDEALSAPPARVDVVLLDIKLNGASGLDAIELLRRQWPTVAVLMLSSQDEPETIRLAMDRGAAGFVSKAETSKKIIENIQRVFLSHTSARQSPDAPPERRLTPRQSEVLQLLHKGYSNKKIAQALTLSENTVRRHVQGILEFFDSPSRAEAVFAAVKVGLVG
jgi:DNA-binding NarL/FixJ family response regulator